MIEISLWVPVIALELGIVLIMAVAGMAWRNRQQRLAYEEEIARLGRAHKDGSASTDVSPEATGPVASSNDVGAPAADDEGLETPGPARLVLLSAEDVSAATPPVGPDAATTADQTNVAELLAGLVERNQALTDRLNGLLERSAELGVQLGSLHGMAGLPDEGKERIQLAIDYTRETDNVLVEASDAGMEIDESIRYLASLSEISGPAAEVDHVSLNEILMARADGQTEEELAQLREEVKKRLLGLREARVETNEPGEVDVLRTELDQERKQREMMRLSLAEVTEEYQRLFEQFQPSA